MTKSKFESLGDKAQWDIKVALRGPDSHYGETLKWFTTAVIRGKMRGVFRVGGLVNEDLDLVVIPSGELSTADKAAYKAAGEFGWNYSHFAEHISTAARWLDIPILLVEAAVWHEAMRESGTKAAAERIFTAAEKWAEKQEKAVNSETGEITWDKFYKTGISRPDKLYAPAAVKELKRHIEQGGRYL